jgi:hypothetical protein
VAIGGSERFLWVVLLGGLALGCGNDVPPASRGPMAGEPVEDLLRCNITERDCQEAIFVSVAESLGSHPNSPPLIRTISVEEYEAELRDGLDPDDYLGAAPITRGLELMGLLSGEATNLIDAEIDNLVNWVGAYFDPSTRRITVIDRDYEDISAQSLLAHEFVHAIQERDFGFASLTATEGLEDSFSPSGSC